MVWVPTSNTFATPGSSSRTRRPIAEAVRDYVNTKGLLGGSILELASGFGDHIESLAQELPYFQFQPTEAQSECLKCLLELCKVSNIQPARKLNVLDEDDWKNLSMQYTGLICINMIHLCPWEGTRILFEQAASKLDCQFVVIYGAFLQDDGGHRSTNDKIFDENIQRRDPSFGLRNPRLVNEIAQSCNYRRAQQVDMPLSNLLCIWEKSSCSEHT